MGRAVKHVWADLKDGVGPVVVHALTEPEGGDEKIDVQKPDGSRVSGLERGAADQERRGWWPCD